MKVYLDGGGEPRLVGRADVPDGRGPVFEVPLPGAATAAVERFALAAVARLAPGGGDLAVERVVMARPGQRLGLLPGWVPLAS